MFNHFHEWWGAMDADDKVLWTLIGPPLVAFFVFVTSAIAIGVKFMVLQFLAL